MTPSASPAPRGSLRPAALVLAVVATAAGCATTSADFQLSKIAADDAAIAGRLTIIYNGQRYTENCYAIFGARRLKLSTDGIVLFSVAKGWTSLEQLECKDSSLQHVRITGAHFFALGDGQVSEFGDVAITWEAAGGFKVTSLFGLIGALVDSAIDDGVAAVEVGPPAVEVRDAFRRQTGVEGRWVIQPLSQPDSPIARMAAGPNHPALAAATAPRGFFCTSSSSRDGLSLCEREQSVCEHVRSALGGPNQAPCTSAETAWCLAVLGQLRCFGTERACQAHRAKAPSTSDLCGQQY